MSPTVQDEITYFRWRTCLFGAEQFWHGILPHNGVPGRRYSEIQETIQILTPVMDDIHGIVQKAQAGILFSYENEWAIRLQPQKSWIKNMMRWFLSIIKNFINIILQWILSHLVQIWGKYRILVAPLYI